MQRDKRLEFRVGLFVFLAIVIGGGMAFVIGNQRNVFEPKTTYTAVFDEVGGLRPGSPVQLAGVVVGSVTNVRFVENGRIEVTFRITRDAGRLVRGDVNGPHPDEVEPDEPKGTVAAVGAKGLLGDRLIDLSVGAPSLDEWDPEVAVPTARAEGLIDQATAAIAAVQGTAENLESATDPFADQQFSNDLKETAHNLAEITGMLAEGDGTVQRLMTDPDLADEVEATLANLRNTSSELAQVSRSVRQIADEVRSGDGSAHRIIYGPETADAVASFGRASEEVSVILGDVREGEGTIHDLIYEDAATELMQNLTAASEDIAAITEEIRAGRGTIGGLVMDPSIYEDVKRLVGDLQRNEILRALVRYSIRRDDAASAAEVTEESD